MAQGGSSGGESVENGYDNLPFADLEKAKEIEEGKLNEFETTFNKTRDSLSAKENEAKDTKLEYDRSVKKWKELDEAAKGMNKEITDAVSEWNAARDHFNAANKLYNEFVGVTNDLAKAKADVEYINKASQREPELTKELSDWNTNCKALDASKNLYDYNKNVESAKEELQTAQDDVKGQEEFIANCKIDCEHLPTQLATLRVTLGTAKTAYEKAEKDHKYFTECPGKQEELKKEAEKMKKIKIDPTKELTEANAKVDELEPKSKDKKYDNAEQLNIDAERALKEKETAKTNAAAKPNFTPKQVRDAKEIASAEKRTWTNLAVKENHLDGEIKKLKLDFDTHKKIYDAKFEDVKKLRKLYAEKQKGEDPGTGSATTIAVVVIVIIIIAAAAAVGFVCIRKRGKKKDDDKTTNGNPSSVDAASLASATPAASASAAPSDVAVAPAAAATATPVAAGAAAAPPDAAVAAAATPVVTAASRAASHTAITASASRAPSDTQVATSAVPSDTQLTTHAVTPGAAAESAQDQEDANKLRELNTPPYADEKVGTAVLVKHLPESTVIERKAKAFVMNEANPDAFAFFKKNMWLFQTKSEARGILLRMLVVQGLHIKSLVFDANMIKDHGDRPTTSNTAQGVITHDPSMCSFKVSKQTGKFSPTELVGAEKKKKNRATTRDKELKTFSPRLTAQKLRDREKQKEGDRSGAGRDAGNDEATCETQPEPLAYNEYYTPNAKLKEEATQSLHALTEEAKRVPGADTHYQELIDYYTTEHIPEIEALGDFVDMNAMEENPYADNSENLDADNSVATAVDKSENPAADNIENPAADNIENPAADNSENPVADNSENPAADNSENPAAKMSNRLGAGGEGESKHESQKDQKDGKSKSDSEKKPKKKGSKGHKRGKNNSGSEKKHKKKGSKGHKGEKNNSGAKKHKKKGSKGHQGEKSNSDSDKDGSSRKSDESDGKSNQDSRQVSTTKQEEEPDRIGFNANKDFIFMIENYKPDLKIWTNVKEGQFDLHEQEWKNLLRSLIATAGGTDPLKKYKFNFRKQLLPILVAYTQIFLSNHKEGERKFLDRPNEPLPTTTITDIHGNVEILEQAIREFGEIGTPAWKARLYIFTGDYVDRGKNQLEVIVIVLLLYMIYPDNVVVLRGNHEFYETNIVYGFLDEMEDRFPKEEATIAHFFCNYAFAYMPLCCRVTTGNNASVVYAHGGIHPSAYKLEQINQIPDFVFQLCFGKEWWREVTHSIVWTDPTYLMKFVKNKRGAGYEVGIKEWEAFFVKNKIALFVRGHQVMENGFEFYFDGRVLTVYASPYSESRVNRGAVAHINKDGRLYFTIYVPYDPKQTAKMDAAQTNQFHADLTEKARASHNAHNLRIEMKGVEGLQGGGEVVRDDTIC